MRVDWAGAIENENLGKIFIGGEEFTGIGYQGLMTVNTKTYVEEPTRANDGSIPNIDDHDTFIVPRCKVNFKFFNIRDYQRLCRVLNSANQFPVKYFDKQFGEFREYYMYVEPEEMAKIYNVGTSVIGVLDYEVSFIGTLNNLEEFNVKYDTSKLTRRVISEYDANISYSKDTVVSVSGYDVRYYKYKNDTSKDAVLKNITTPVFDLLDDLFEKPVKTALEILPNVVYFIDSGNLEVCITNLLLPVTALLEKIEPIYKVELDTDSITASMNINDLLGSLEDSLGLKLKSADLKALYSYGETETKQSKQVMNGKNTSYTYIKADKEALLLTVLRYLVDTLKLPENKGALNGLMSGGSADSFALYASQIFEQFEAMTTDQIIEWLHNLLFKERVIVPLEEGETEEEKDNLDRLNNDLCFVVDPLDGTKEFLKRNNHQQITQFCL